MRRRDFLTVVGGVSLAMPGLAHGQSGRVYRLGTLLPGPPMLPTEGRGAILIENLGKLGYKLGENLVYETRGAKGKVALVPQMMLELVAAKVDAVVTVSYPAAAAAKASGIATVIASGSGDPVTTGLVNSLAKPGGTVTGIADDAAMLSTKRLSLLKALLPKLQKVAMLWNKEDLGMSQRYEASAKAARDIGVQVQALGVREPDDFDDAFTTMNRENPEAILMVSDSLTLLNRKRVIQYAATRRIPAIYEADNIVHDGGLMSYGADEHESFGRAAALVGRIFKGAKPAELPVEQPTRYLFVINMTTAKAMNLSVPNNLAALADEIIELSHYALLPRSCQGALHHFQSAHRRPQVMPVFSAKRSWTSMTKLDQLENVKRIDPVQAKQPLNKLFLQRRSSDISKAANIGQGCPRQLKDLFDVRRNRGRFHRAPRGKFGYPACANSTRPKGGHQ
jgi:putative ABC transport system substrate-binding protein